MLRGLFIGVDRYQSQAIKWLTGARHDAIALHALFADTLGGVCTLLTDDAATKEQICTELDSIVDCDEEDLVVVSFSGHGTETHELVTYDTQVEDLQGTGLPLSDLAALLHSIPAKRLLLFLDCCFSGGMDTKVISIESISRDWESVDHKLNQLAGEGRLVFTASAADEPAWENQRTGHGNFTHFLLEALQGPADVVENGTLKLYRLLEYVTQRVSAAAQEFGQSQRPTLRGSIDGEMRLPIFVPADRYRAAFPDRIAARATESILSLSTFGFSAELISAWGSHIPSLNALQLAAINEHGVLAGNHLLVVAPTSSGKTMIGELGALKAVSQRKRAVFLFPLKALVADKRRHFDATYQKYGLRTIEATGETDDVSPLIRGQYDIALLTYEKFSAIALSQPHVLAQVGTIVVDEVQMLADRSRGANLEFLLTLIRMRRQQGVEPQIIALSGVVGATKGLDLWLGASLLRHEERPVPLEEGLLLANGNFRYLSTDSKQDATIRSFIRMSYRKGSSQDYVIPLVTRLVAEGKQVIVFRYTKGETRGCANYLAEALNLPPADEALARLPQGDLSRASRALHQAIAGGVSFHNADLDREERRVIEEEFRRPDSKIRVIVATTTLAMGINTPAGAVVVAGVERADGPYSVSEYKNLVGRAGRLGYAERGQSFLLATTPREASEYWLRYIIGKPEELRSRFVSGSVDPRTLIVRVLAATRRLFDHGLSTEQLVQILDSSFGAFQERQSNENWSWDMGATARALNQLEHHNLVERQNGALSLTPLGLIAGESGAEVASVIELVRCLKGLSPKEVTDQALIAAVQTTAELDATSIPLNKRSTIKEPQTWSSKLRDHVAGGLVAALNQSVREWHIGTARHKRAIACLLYISRQEMSSIELLLTQFGRSSDGAAGPVRSVAARTSDLMPTALRVAHHLFPTLDLEERGARLVTRLTYGVPANAVPLARITGVNLSRGDYLQLANQNLCDPQTIATATDEELLACVGQNRELLLLIREAGQTMAENFTAPGKIDIPAYEP